MEIVNKNSPLPCYYQVYLYLKKNIENHTFSCGQQLPSERLLSERFNVNRFTIRRAIENLIGDGLVYPIRRKGYFVKTDDLDILIHKKTSYTQNMLEKNLTPRVEILGIETSEPSDEYMKLFNIDKKDKVWVLCFLRYYNTIPMALSRCILPYESFPDLNIHISVNRSLYNILNTQYDIITTRVSSVCEVSSANKKEAKYLFVLGDAPLLKVTSTAVDQNGRYIERSISKFRSDMVKIKIDLQNS